MEVHDQFYVYVYSIDIITLNTLCLQNGMHRSHMVTLEGSWETTQVSKLSPTPHRFLWNFLENWKSNYSHIQLYYYLRKGQNWQMNKIVVLFVAAVSYSNTVMNLFLFLFSISFPSHKSAPRIFLRVWILNDLT